MDRKRMEEKVKDVSFSFLRHSLKQYRNQLNQLVEISYAEGYADAEQRVNNLEIERDKFNDALGKSYEDYKKLNARSLELEKYWSENPLTIDLKRKCEQLAGALEKLTLFNDNCGACTWYRGVVSEALKLYRECK